MLSNGESVYSKVTCQSVYSTTISITHIISELSSVFINWIEEQ